MQGYDDTHIAAGFFVDYPYEQMEEDREYGLYWVAKGFLPVLQERLDKLNRKAEKMQMPLIGYEVVSEEHLDVYVSERAKEMGDSPLYAVAFAVVQIDGESPVFAGWEFQATVKPVPGTNKALMLTSPEAEIPDRIIQRTNEDPFYCDHCKTKRKRNETFLIKELETGKYKQVGRTCVKDFLGHKSPQDIAMWYTGLNQVFEDLDESSGVGGSAYLRPEINVSDFLGYIYAWYREAGYQKGMGSNAYYAFMAPRKEDRAKVTDEEKKLGAKVAKKVLEMLDKPDNQLSNYEYNVKIGLEAAYVSRETANFVGSSVIMYGKAFGEDGRKKQKKSEWVGKVGERLRGLDLTVTRTKWIESLYGTSQLVIFEDSDGNEFKWFNSGRTEAEIDARYKVDGRVKKHEEYRGKKSTALTRCTLKPV